MESDFSAVHRIDDMYELDSIKFFRLASRLDAYKGVIRSRLEAESEEQEQSSRRTWSYDEEVTEIASTPEAFRANPALADLVDFQTSTE